MVEATINNGIVNLESTLQITEGQRDKIKANPAGVKSILNDMHTEHFLSITEDGIIISKMGEQVQNKFNPQTVVTNLKNKHQEFLRWVDKLPNVYENVEVEKQNNAEQNNAGKYYQKDGSFVDKQTDDSIGLCIISLASGHVVMALDDCKGMYTYDEAMKEVKNHFNGKGEIPSISEMIEAFQFKNELDLKLYTDYRAVRFGDSARYAGAVLRFAYMGGAPSLAAAACGSNWAICRMKLRPIMRVK